MRRVLRAGIVFAVVALVSIGAQAKLSKGDRTKLTKFLADILSPTVTEDARLLAHRNFVDFFAQGNRDKDLADVADMTDLLAASGSRPNQRVGMATRELTFGGAKLTCALSVPKKYAGTETSDPWPLIVCLPDRGQKAEEYLAKYWPDEVVREAAIIAVLVNTYADKIVPTRKQVADKDGKVRFETVNEKVPFAWGTGDAAEWFWSGVAALHLREFKVDPNRIILDGAGMGATGALTFASSNAWRFGGIVLRGGSLDGLAAENLAHMKVLSRPAEIADEAAKKAAEATAVRLKEIVKDGYADGAALDAAGLVTWLTGAARARYPLPHKWTRSNDSEQFSYWFAVTEVFNPEEPAVMTLSSDRAKKRVDVEAKNVGEFTLFVNDVLVDMAQPFDLYVNGELVRKQVSLPRSAVELLAHAIEKMPLDPGAVFTNELAGVKIAPPKKEEPKKEEPKKEEPKKEDGEKKPEPPTPAPPGGEKNPR